jgi:hypothetical protein
LAIRREGEALLSDWRSRDVPAQSLESTTKLDQCSATTW